MVEERTEVVYDIGYGYDNPCRYIQQVFRSFLRCLGLEKQEGKERNPSGGGGEVDDPPGTLPMMDPTDGPVSTTGIARRPPPRGSISSGGPGQTN